MNPECSNRYFSCFESIRRLTARIAFLTTLKIWAQLEISNVLVLQFFSFKGSNSSSKEELTRHYDCEMIIARADSFLDNLINSVENGTVTIATLELLEKHENQFLKLGEIHQKNKNIQISIKNSFRQRRSEKKAFFTLRGDVECFINFSISFTSGISV